MSQRVRIVHPGYKSLNVLFVLPTTDRDERDYIYYPTLWDACSIIINNRRDHWLSLSRTGEPRASADANGLIAAGDYFLHVPGSESEDAQPYPIVPNFREWRFPHNYLPELWRAASRNDELLASQENFTLTSVAVEKCRITERELGAHEAHIIQKEEKPWFLSNEMEDCVPVSTRSGETMAEMYSNKMRLRCDAHMLWDRCDFSIVPREISGNTAWYTQVMNHGEELHKYWHLKALLPLPSRPPQYLYARFAYNLFAKLHRFLHAGSPRFLVVYRTDKTVEERQFSADECRQFTENQGQSRSVSAKKRSKNRVDKPDDRTDDACSVDSALGDFQDEKWRSDNLTLDISEYKPYDFEEHERGRKRLRGY